MFNTWCHPTGRSWVGASPCQVGTGELGQGPGPEEEKQTDWQHFGLATGWARRGLSLLMKPLVKWKSDLMLVSRRAAKFLCVPPERSLSVDQANLCVNYYCWGTKQWTQINGIIIAVTEVFCANITRHGTLHIFLILYPYGMIRAKGQNCYK